MSSPNIDGFYRFIFHKVVQRRQVCWCT